MDETKEFPPPDELAEMARNSGKIDELEGVSVPKSTAIDVGRKFVGENAVEFELNGELRMISRGGDKTFRLGYKGSKGVTYEANFETWKPGEAFVGQALTNYHVSIIQ